MTVTTEVYDDVSPYASITVTVTVYVPEVVYVCVKMVPRLAAELVACVPSPYVTTYVQESLRYGEDVAFGSALVSVIVTVPALATTVPETTGARLIT